MYSLHSKDRPLKNFDIRPLERGDLERVGHLVGVNDMFPPEMLAEMTATYFNDPDSGHRWLVATGAEVEGVAYYVPEPLTDGTWNLLLIAVDPGRHGGGIGQALMHHVEDAVAASRARVLLVETSGTEGFARTRRFYQQLGYDREACIRDYYAAGDDKIVFRKALE